MEKIICIKGNCNTGKTTTVRSIYKRITGKTAPGVDINVVVVYNKKRIALVSAGDPGQDVYNKVKGYVEADEVDIIIFCARTKYFKTRPTVYEKEIAPHIQNNTFLGVDYKEYTLHKKFKKNGSKEDLDEFINECEDLATKILSTL